MTKEKLPRIGSVPLSAGGLMLEIARAQVQIKRGEASEIVVSAANSDHWLINADGTIKQNLPEPEVGKVYISSGAASGNGGGSSSGLFTSLFGRLGLGLGSGSGSGSGLGLGSGSKKSKSTHNTQSIIQCNGQTQIIVDHDGTHLEVTVVGEPRVSIVNGDIFLNDKKLDLSSCEVVRGSSPRRSGILGKGRVLADSFAAPKAMDELEILVPQDFSGSLRVEIDDGSLRFDFWEGGDLVLACSGDASIDVGPISHVNLCRVSSTGDGSIWIDEIRADQVVFELTDDGALSTQDIYCRKFKSTQSADGDITIVTLDARERAEISLTDDGNFWATKFCGGDLVTLQSGDGDLNIDAVDAHCVTSQNTDDGSFSGNEFAAVSLTSQSSGDGSVEFETVNVEQKIDLRATDDGGFNLGEVSCASFSSTHNGDGGLHVRKLKTGELVIVSTDDAELFIASGSAAGGSISNLGDGSINLSRSFASITRRNTGDGEIVFR